jgi:cyclopropane-fatty-acyl-phospholipid synthase
MPGEPLVARARRVLSRTALEPLAGRVLDAAISSAVARLADSVRAGGGQPLEFMLPDGSRLGFGQPARVVLNIRDSATLVQLARPTLDTLGTAFVEGRLDVEGDLLDAVQVGEALARAWGSPSEQRRTLPVKPHRATQDAEAIAYHYDVGNDFYSLWLDPQQVYSCAYFTHEHASLADAQVAKLDHICRKLRLQPGERFLDVGCGWGALVRHAASKYGVTAVGVTLSKQQFEYARARVAAEGLDDRVDVLLLDYRDLVRHFGPQRFDKAASIGMFEHVGLRQLPQYFGAVATVLRDRGLFLNHGITSSDVDNRPVGAGASEFIDKYVFPHGELPHLALAVREMSAAGFEVADVESLRAHYALTCMHWSRRLDAAVEAARRLVPEKTLRIWRAYLAGCAVGFRQGWMNVYQVLGSKQAAAGATDLPLTRNWIYAD